MEFIQTIPDYFFIGIAFIFGSAIGSFFSVLISRHHHKQPGIIFGRSQCPKCHKNIKFYDLIPLFSFILLHGKCRHCKKEFGREHFYLELFMGFLYALLLIYFPFYQNLSSITETATLHLFLQFFLYTTTATLLIGIFFYDLLYLEIPDIFSIPTFVTALIAAIIFQTPSWQSILIAILISLLFFGGQIVISRGKWLGNGDLILAIIMSVILGWEKLLLATLVAYLIGATWGISLLLLKKATSKSQIPFGPFLITGTIIAFFWGEQLIKMYLDLLFV